MLSTSYNGRGKLWHGRDIPPLYNPNINLAQALFNAMNVFGSKIAQISDDSGIHMTFDEIHTNAIRAAQNLQTQGYQQNQVFGMLVRNSHHLASIFVASIAIGCPINALDPSFGKTEIIHMLSIVKPVLVFCDIACYELLTDCLSEVGNKAKVFTFGGQKGESEAIENLFKETHKEHEFIPAKVDGTQDTAAIVCSSGTTTGLPKGVCLSHAALLDAYTIKSSVISHNNVVLCFSTLYWISGIDTLIFGTLTGATRIITTDIFTPELQLRLIEQYKITFTLNATHQIVLITKCDRFRTANLRSWKFITAGGSPIPFYVKGEMACHLANASFISAYGMSETSGMMTLDYPTLSESDTVGRLYNGCQLKIIDDHGKRCDINEIGEVYIKMRYQFLGYYGNQQATDETIDEDGFLKSGDLGYFDAHGELHITGRKKELLKYCNFPISPTEIDAYLTESSDIEAACVFGIPDTSMATDLPAAAIVRAKGSKITENDVGNLVADHFADHCKLRGGVYFLDSMPTTASGKISRKLVKEKIVDLLNERIN